MQGMPLSNKTSTPEKTPRVPSIPEKGWGETARQLESKFFVRGGVMELGGR